MGMTLAKYSEITYKEGRVEQTNYSDYPVIRIDKSPLEGRGCISCRQALMCPQVALANRECRHSRRPSATPSSRLPASGFAACQSVISWRNRIGVIKSDAFRPRRRTHDGAAPSSAALFISFNSCSLNCVSHVKAAHALATSRST